MLRVMVSQAAEKRIQELVGAASVSGWIHRLIQQELERVGLEGRVQG